MSFSKKMGLRYMLDKDTVIYHYCSVEAFVNILKTNSIWLTHAREMNDTLEDEYFSAPLKKALQSFNDISESEQDLLQQIISAYLERVTFPYVACFSREDDVLSQWRAYADDGRGIAIGFKVGAIPHVDLFRRQYGEDSDSLIIIDEVSYKHADDEVQFMQKVLSACLINYRKTNDKATVIKQGICALSMLSIYSKGKGFEEEQEIRLVFYPSYRDLVANLNCEPPCGEDAAKIQFRVRDGRIISYFPFTFCINAIQSITLGPKCSVDFSQLALFLNQYAPKIRINNAICKSKISYR